MYKGEIFHRPVICFTTDPLEDYGSRALIVSVQVISNQMGHSVDVDSFLLLNLSSSLPPSQCFFSSVLTDEQIN